MLSSKMTKLSQDLDEVKDKFENLNLDVKGNDIFINGYEDLKEAIEILEGHLKDHVETVENFICDIK